MVYLHGLGHFHPENVIDNQFLEDLDIGTNDQWIMERVGIQTRRTVLDLDYIKKTKNRDIRQSGAACQYTNAQTGKLAAEMAIEKAGITKEQIGMVIAGGCTPDTTTPAEACVIACELGIQTECLDLNSACSSFGAQIHFLFMMRPDALPDFILLVHPENTTRAVDYSDRSTAVLWGDGTSAAVISTRVPSKAKVVFTTLTSDPANWDKAVIQRTGYFKQEGSAVQAFAIRKTVQCFRDIQARYPEKAKDLYFIGHQANLRMLESVCKRCDIAPEKHFFNVDVYGNTGAAGAPSILSQHWEKFKVGDVLGLVVVGAGLSWASMAIEFSDVKGAKRS
ncbi:MAG: ketoacyl-ACP synthase III [Candidatus Omnitrophica bacterium]|nr:ketoacyl-ACP synthase III [Candidatus Omnitrophota bacterium]